MTPTAPTAAIPTARTAVIPTVPTTTRKTATAWTARIPTAPTAETTTARTAAIPTAPITPDPSSTCEVSRRRHVPARGGASHSRGPIVTLTFAETLGPVAVDDFLGRIWGRTFAFLPGPRGRFQQLLPWSTVNEM